jgi:uncharacterized protein YbjQ (UPF0145 family)
MADGGRNDSDDDSDDEGGGDLARLVADILKTVRRYIKMPQEPGSPAPGSTGEASGYRRPAMNASRAREQALEELHRLLDGTGTGAVIHITTWPEDVGERRAVWAHLEATLRVIQQDGAVRVKAHGAARGCYSEVPWPAMPGLFPEEEPPRAAPREVSKAPTGEEVASPIAAPPSGLNEALARAQEEVAKPVKASVKCAGHVLQVLFDQQRRLTTSGMNEALALARLEWSARTVEATLAWLVQRGDQVDNDHDQRGRGYGLVDWEKNPAPSDDDGGR